MLQMMYISHCTGPKILYSDRMFFFYDYIPIFILVYVEIQVDDLQAELAYVQGRISIMKQRPSCQSSKTFSLLSFDSTLSSVPSLETPGFSSDDFASLDEALFKDVDDKEMLA